jgi:hypothetical protein
VLIGASEADAQRVRGGNGDRNRGPVERLEPVRAPGRVVAPRATRVRAGAPRHRAGRNTRVVYSSRSTLPRYRRTGAWVRVDWGRSVRFRVVRGRSFRGFLNGRELRDVLGHRTVRLIRDAGHDVGLRGALRGRWLAEPGLGDVLVVTMGGADVAEVLDYNRDGFVDDVWIIGRRGFRPVIAPR